MPPDIDARETPDICRRHWFTGLFADATTPFSTFMRASHFITYYCLFSLPLRLRLAGFADADISPDESLRYYDTLRHYFIVDARRHDHYA